MAPGNLTSGLRPPRWAAFVILGVALASYLNCLSNGFVYDDKRYVVENEDIRSLGNLKAIFRHDVWGWPRGHPQHTGAYRPVSALSFAVNYAFTGLHASGYHLVNIGLHALVCLLLFAIGRELFDNWTVSFLAALLFAVHPVHTEAVSAIYGRPELLAALAFFAGLWLYLRYVARPNLLALAGILAVFLVGLFSKENVMTLPGVLVLCDFVFRKKRGPFLKETLFTRPRVQMYGGMVVTALLYLWVRHLAVGSLTHVPYTIVENPMAFAAPLPRWLTRLYLLVLDARLLVFPVWLSADYSFNQVPLIQSLGDSRNVRTGALLVVLAGSLVWSYRKSRTTFFCLMFGMISFSITANLFVPLGTVLAERVLYVPSWGFCVLAAVLLQALGTKMGRKPFWVCSSLLAVLLGARTVSRNRDWRSDWTLWRSAERVCSSSIKVNHNLGVLYAQGGDSEEAEKYYRRALEILPGHVPTLVGLAGVLTREGKYREAEKLYLEAEKQKSEDAELAYSLGLCRQKAKKWRDAAGAYRQALSRDPGLLKAWLNLGYCQEKAGDSQGAANSYRKAAKRFPGKFDPVYNLVLLYVNGGRLEKASETLARAPLALQKHPQLLRARYNLAVGYLRRKDYSAVIQHFGFILSHDPTFPNAARMRRDMLRWQKLGL